LIRHARGLGLGVSVAPSATPRLDADAIAALKTAGTQSISLSLDGASAAHQAAVRGVPGCYARTIEAAAEAQAAGLPFQINTLVSAETVDDLGLIYEQTARLGAARWSLFFLVTVGRGAVLAQITPERFRQVLEWLVTLPAARGPIVATTEAPQLRRLQVERSGWRARCGGRHPRRQRHHVRVAYRRDQTVGILAAICGQRSSPRRRDGLSNVVAVPAVAAAKRLRRSMRRVPLSRRVWRLAGSGVRRRRRSVRRRSALSAGLIRSRL